MSATPDSTLANPEQLIADLQRQLAESEAQKAAMAEVLAVINASPGDLTPVFDAILEKAMRLCEAAFGHLDTYDGNSFHTSAIRGVPIAYAEYRRNNPPNYGPGTGPARMLAGERIVHHLDMMDEEAYSRGEQNRRALVDLGGARSAINVALVKDRTFLGFITLFRQEVRPFSDKQIALVENFAAQAVIAMENARLITETREALEQQTATAEVLQVINSSPGDLAPVFEAILEKAHALCGADFGNLMIYDGELMHSVAFHGEPTPWRDYLATPYRPTATSPSWPLFSGAELIHIGDLATIGGPGSENEVRQAAVELGGIRTLLMVPLRKEMRLLGIIVAYRQEVRPFTEKQIALLQNFAAQAVIAMENARLITETREALEQQTATAEVLQVINSSPGVPAPVFDAMLEKALHLCEAAFGLLSTYDGEQFHSVSQHGVPEEFVQRYLREPFRTAPNTTHDRLIRGEDLVHVTDLATEGIDNPRRRAVVQVMGARTILGVALRKDGTLLGAIHIYRKEVHPFSDKQIALLQNFAAQAVIAMENARLITETREALEQQTATAEVLGVINSSPGDLNPVFDAILEKAHTLCGAAAGGLVMIEGDQYGAVAVHGEPSFAKFWMELGWVRAAPGAFEPLRRGEPLHTPDVAADDRSRLSPQYNQLVELSGARSLLIVPLYKDNALLGMITAFRQEVRAFSAKQIALLQNFAAQAVIAMENARLLTETREALEQQTATAEILRVISSSPADLQPTFDAIAAAARMLTDAALGSVVTYDGTLLHAAAFAGYTPDEVEKVRELFPIPADHGSANGRAILTRQVAHIEDMGADPDYAYPTLAESSGQTVLGVPMLRDGAPIGAINVQRRRKEPFTDKQIELIKTFAAQPVIAMENARLITETREALEQQTATAEVLQVINSSPGNLPPVYAAILEKAHNLCGIAVGTLQLYEGAKVRAVAQRGVTGQWAELLREPFEPATESPPARLSRGERIVHLIDQRMDVFAKQQADNPRAQAAVQQGLRTALWVPLRKDAELWGYISAFRQEVRPFSDKEIALLESFAAQAVIAIDNARLLNEIRQRQAELRVTFDNMGDGVAMFDGELRLAAWNLNFQRILDLPDPLLAERPRVANFVRYLVTHGEYGAVDVEAEVRRLSERAGTQWSAERTRPDGRVIEVRSNPVPGGGVVLMYSDVTERKRAEAEIRAARDTAERALQELQTTQASLVHAQKMAALGQLTAGIAHEIKNPLNFVNNFAELSGELLLELEETTAPAVAALGDDEQAAVDEVVEMLRGNLNKIAEHGKRADGIVKSMLEHSRGVSGERRVVDLHALIEEALNLAYHGARAQDASFNITLEREFHPGLAPIELAPQEMTRVFLNLFGNGFYATTRRQRDGAEPDFRPTLKVATRDLGDSVEVRVRDNGTGIVPEIRDKLFQPFVTTKPTGEGTGLGLSIAYDIVVQQHGGTIEVDSREGEFTEFTVCLPRRAVEAAV
jgi:GAF domain-containing protein